MTTSTKPLISLVVPVYNGKKFIGSTIESILGVTRDFSVEVIFQNARSNDGTTEIIEEYCKKLESFTHFNEGDKGQSDGINKGIERARGEWVTWLCADDLLLTGFREVLKEARSSEFDVIYGDVVMLSDGKIGSAIGTESYEPGKLIKKRMYIQQPGTIIRKTKWDEIGGLNLSLNWTMDYDLFIRLEQAGSIFRRCKKFVSVARIHDEAKTSSGSLRRLAEHYRVLLKSQLKNPRHTSLVPYFAYFIEYTIKKIESRGGAPRILHRIFWKVTKPSEIDQISSRFSSKRLALTAEINELELR